MAEAINTVHEDEFFSGDSAGTIKVNDDISKDHSLVNAGKLENSPEGDGSRALAIARLRNTKLVFSENPSFDYDAETMSIINDPNGVTIEGAYGNIVTIIGISKEHADNMVDNQEVLLQQLEMHRESTSGVSIDEEISDLIKYQKAYEANARVISVLTEMLDTLINRTGV